MENYNVEIKKIKEKVSLLKQIADYYNFTGVIDKAEKFQERLKNDQFIITVIGEFNRGKSTFINALLGVDIIPTSIRPTTATLNIIRYNENPGIKVHKQNGEIIVLNFSKNALYEFTSLVDFDPHSVKFVEVMYPVEYLKDGTILVDTPGVNDINQQRLDITYGYMPISDAVIFLLDAATPFKQTEKIFLEEHVLSNNISSMFFIANKIDVLSLEEITESVQSIKDNLKMMKIEQDRNSVFLLSSKEALASKLSDVDGKGAVEDFKRFEDELKKFILGDQRSHTKIENFRKQLIELGLFLLEEIEVETNNIGKTQEELLEIKAKIEKSEYEYTEYFNKLLKKIDDQKDALNTRLESQLLKDFNDVKEALLLEADLAKGDLTEYAEKIIPYKINQATKRWIEKSQPFIEQNIMAIFNKALMEYKNYFSKAPIIRQLNPGDELALNTQVGAIEITGKEDISKINKICMVGGSLIMGGITAVLTGGIGLPVVLPTIMGGKYGQLLVGTHFIKKKYKEQKEQILKILPNILINAYDSLNKNTKNFIEYKFKIFKESLQSEFKSTFADLKNNVQMTLNNKKLEEDKLLMRQRKLKEDKLKINKIITLGE